MKWTDLGTFLATAVQSAVVIVALIVAYVQYLASVRSGRVQMFNDVTKEIQADEIRTAIDHTSGHLDYRQDWPEITADLQRAADAPERLRREKELFEIANLFSRIEHLYEANVIDRRLFLAEYDEYVLFVAGAVSGVSAVYAQPDYTGLFDLARICQKHYAAHDGRYALLRNLDIPVETPGITAH